MDKLRDTLQKMSNSGLAFIKTGYDLKSTSINMGLPPVITMSFKYMNRISQDERTAILEEVKERKILRIVISCLLKAEDFYDSVKIGEYKLDSVNITHGLIPSVSVVFGKQN